DYYCGIWHSNAVLF
nr:immunoglobulin light chain junction region [Macaca mulatta]